MAVFRVERNTGYTVMSNHHLRNKELCLEVFVRGKWKPTRMEYQKKPDRHRGYFYP